MRPILVQCNANCPDIIPCVVTHAPNPNDIMHSSPDMHILLSQSYLSNYYATTITYWTGMQAGQLTTTNITTSQLGY